MRRFSRSHAASLPLVSSLRWRSELRGRKQIHRRDNLAASAGAGADDAAVVFGMNVHIDAVMARGALERGASVSGPSLEAGSRHNKPSEVGLGHFSGAKRRSRPQRLPLLVLVNAEE